MLTTSRFVSQTSIAAIAPWPTVFVSFFFFFPPPLSISQNISQLEIFGDMSTPPDITSPSVSSSHANIMCFPFNQTAFFMGFFVLLLAHLTFDSHRPRRPPPTPSTPRRACSRLRNCSLPSILCPCPQVRPRLFAVASAATGTGQTNALGDKEKLWSQRIRMQRTEGEGRGGSVGINRDGTELKCRWLETGGKVESVVCWIWSALLACRLGCYCWLTWSWGGSGSRRKSSCKRWEDWSSCWSLWNYELRLLVLRFVCKKTSHCCTQSNEASLLSHS